MGINTIVFISFHCIFKISYDWRNSRRFRYYIYYLVIEILYDILGRSFSNNTIKLLNYVIRWRGAHIIRSSLFPHHFIFLVFFSHWLTATWSNGFINFLQYFIGWCCSHVILSPLLPKPLTVNISLACTTRLENKLKQYYNLRIQNN